MASHEEKLSFFPADDINEKFWYILDQAKKNKKKLYDILYAFERQEIIDFEYNFMKTALQLYDEPFLVQIGVERSEDIIEDICEWVVSQGKEYYFQIWNNPKLIPKNLDRNKLEEILSGVPGEVFWDKFEEEIRDFIDPE